MARCSLAEQDLATSTDVLSSLSSALVGTSLKTDNGLTGLKDFIGEFTLALLRGLGAKVWAAPFRMPVGLPNNKLS